MVAHPRRERAGSRLEYGYRHLAEFGEEIQLAGPWEAHLREEIVVESAQFRKAGRVALESIMHPHDCPFIQERFGSELDEGTPEAAIVEKGTFPVVVPVPNPDQEIRPSRSAERDHV